jgi:hypothetical protein
MLDKLTTTYKNNIIGTVLGVTAGYYLAKKLGYEKTLTIVPFMLVGSLSGANLQAYVRAKKGIPTASLVK